MSLSRSHEKDLESGRAGNCPREQLRLELAYTVRRRHWARVVSPAAMVLRSLIRLWFSQRHAGSEQMVQRLSETPVIRSAAKASAALFLRSQTALTQASQQSPTLLALVTKLMSLLKKGK